MKEEIVKKANEMRLRPVDVFRASDGLVSQAQAGNWLKGKVSAGAAFAMRLLCEKIENGYIIPAPERKERSDKGVPRTATLSGAAINTSKDDRVEVVEITNIKAGDTAVFVGDEIVSYKKAVKTVHVMEDTSERPGFKVKVDGDVAYLSDGEDIYGCSAQEYAEGDRFDLGGEVYDKKIFKK